MTRRLVPRGVRAGVSESIHRQHAVDAREVMGEVRVARREQQRGCAWVFFCALFVLFAFTKTRGRRLDVSVESLLKNRKIIDFKKNG